MKIKCTCGEIIPDQTDYLSYKAHIIGEKNYFDFLDTINEAIERTEENRENCVITFGKQKQTVWHRSATPAVGFILMIQAET